ncbi:MAG: EscU/YscU/HrcU family type III secretion system export apparatus switch protein [Gemmatimonadaceae bacterium]
MAEDADGGEKSEQATGKRQQEARENGQIAKSPELMTAAFLLGSIMTMSYAGPTLWSFLLDTMGQNLRSAADENNGTMAMVAWIQSLGFDTLVAMSGLMAAMAAIAITVQYAQTGGIMSSKVLAPKWSRLNPINNAKNLVGVQGYIELGKSLLKMLIVSWAAYATVAPAWPDIQALAGQSPDSMLAVVHKYGFALLKNCGMMFLALAGADYALQRWRTNESMKMTKQQVKDEAKSQEGDPGIKGRRRSVARERLRRQMFANVKKADVVIVNPTHIAIALKYDTDIAPAPYVLAIGQRKIAQRIKELAFQHGIPVIENKPLARALIASATVGSVIPVEMYLAVAEVLAFVLKQRERYGMAWKGTAVA